MASDTEASCESDPNFAVICAFLEKFGAECGLPNVDFLELQAALENTDEVPGHLIQSILKLLRRVKRSVKNDKWEKALVAVCHNFSSQDAWEIERFGFKKAKLSSKVRVLKELLEMQFDHHMKFKNGVNKLTANELRSRPLGWDKAGHAYWFQSDDNYQIRVYKEDLDEETWTLIAKDRASLVSLIDKLNDGDSKFSSDSAANEDSNSLSDKPIIDTGQTDTDVKSEDKNEEEEQDLIEPKEDSEESVKESEENSKPVLRIKNVTELMSGDLKRPSSDSDDQESQDETVKIKARKPNEDCEVGDAIEEPVLKVQGEGSGKENKGMPLRSPIEVDEDPIVGEAIEEDVMYFHGEGNGFDCSTGNKDRESSSAGAHSNPDDKLSQDSSHTGSINDNISDYKDNKVKAKEVPLIKLGTIIDTKTDNVSRPHSSSSYKSRWDVETVEDQQSSAKIGNLQITGKVKDLVYKFEQVGSSTIQDATVENKTPPVTPKKSTFFFGSGSLSNSVSPSLTMGFGQNSPDRHISDSSHEAVENVKKKVGDDLKENEESEKTGKSLTKINENIGEINKDDQKSIERSNVVEDKREPDVISRSNGKIVEDLNVSEVEEEEDSEEEEVPENLVKQHGGNGKDQITEVEKDVVNKVPVVEPKCIKKTAYVCGNDDDDEKGTTSNSDNKLIPQEDNAENDINEKLIKESVVLEKDKETHIPENAIKIDENFRAENLLKHEGTSDKCDNKIFEAKNVAKEQHNTNDQLTKAEPTVPVKKPQVSLRSIRSKKVTNANSTDNEYQKVFIASLEMKSGDRDIGTITNIRRGRPKKLDANPLNDTSNETRDADQTKQINDEVEELLPTKLGSLSTKQVFSSANKVDATVTKEKNSNAATPDSSRVNSPLSVSESVITLPDSSENTVDYPLKDPLANSDEEPAPPPVQKPLNLQSLSLDFNESSTPPPIPIIPSQRKLRKRGRESSPELKETAVSIGKKMKLKGKRQIDTQLRKSIEQKKQQQVSSSDELHESSDEEKMTRKKGKQAKNKTEHNIDISDEDSDTPVPKPRKKSTKNSRLLANLGITDNTPFETIGVRQSRRLAQIKIKEQAENKKAEVKIKKKDIDKDYKTEKKKKFKEEQMLREETPEPELEDLKMKKRKKYKYKHPNKIFDEKKPWKSSSESSEGDEEVEEEEEEAIEEDDPALEFKSDHEFSPESDLGEDGDSQPLRRARTARKSYEECDEEVVYDDCPCQKCGKSDHPEWILLCDKCDNGWHCSCLRPPLMVIPEGDWFCPPCLHSKLVENLQAKLIEYDKKLSKKKIEDRRKERLAYVGISLNNVLPSREQVHKKKRRVSTVESESSSAASEQSSVSESESDSDEPIYQLRQRRQAKSYKFNEYDDLIKSAIQDEIEEKGLETACQTRGKDIATIVKAEEDERKEKEEQKKKDEGEELGLEKKELVVSPEKPEYSDDDVVKPPVKKPRKKTRKINNLDVSSEEDDERDEDFKGTSSESDEEELDEEEESEEDSDNFVRGGKKRKNLRPVRRSTRARVSRYDADFINDSDADDAPRRKKKKKYWSETDSEESDGSWGRGKKGRPVLAARKKSKKKKKSLLDELSDIEPLKKKKPKIKYGGLTSSDEEMGRRRRTRGKKTTYVDTLGSDSEEESNRKKNPRRIDSDEDDEDFVANEDEKDSEAPDDDLDDEDEDKEEVTGRRAFVPKIYIKKPPVTKEVERPRDKLHLITEDVNKADVSKSVESLVKPKSLEISQPQTNVEANLRQHETVHEKLPGNRVEEKLKSKEGVVTNPAIENRKRTDVSSRNKTNTENDEVEEEGEDNEYGNPIEKINRNLEDMDSDEMEKMMEEEEFANKQLQLVAMQLEKEKKRKAEAKRAEHVEKTVVPPVPAKRGRKPKPKPKELPEPPPKNIVHEPIVSNVRALIRNDNDNDELSEPPGVALPLFEELASRKMEDEMPKKTKGRGRAKKTLEETLANLGGRKNQSKAPENAPQGPGCNIEIAAPPQPFSQAAPTPSVITRMLQSKPGQTTTYPVGTIRPKQFATMPDDDDDSPSTRSRGSSPSTGPPGHIPGPPMGQFMPGGPRGVMGAPFRPMLQGMNHYGRGNIPPHSMRAPGSPGMHPQMYHSHRSHDPSPSGGGAISMSEPNPTQGPPPPANSPGNKMEPHNYSRTPVGRFPPISTAPNMPLTPPRSMHMLSHMQPSRPSNLSPYPPHAQPTNYYGGYPPESITSEDAMPPTVFQNSPYPEQFPTEMGVEPSENSNSKSYGDESGGEFGGLVSYFSSQREDDLES